MEKSKKPLFVYIGYINNDDWQQNLDSEGKTAARDADMLNAIMGDQSKFTGIVLDWFSENVSNLLIYLHLQYNCNIYILILILFYITTQ